mgnify:CR=1 FL=1
MPVIPAPGLARVGPTRHRIGPVPLGISAAWCKAQPHNAEIERYVREWLQKLNDKQRTVIERRYGLNGYEICTLEELAASMSLTRERVRQIQIEGLETLSGQYAASNL